MTCLGSSYRNVGVQPLMDAIVAYAPSPADRRYPFLQYYLVSQNDDRKCSEHFIEVPQV